jgi:hypothetical protein
LKFINMVKKSVSDMSMGSTSGVPRNFFEGEGGIYDYCALIKLYNKKCLVIGLNLWLRDTFSTIT